MCYSGKEKVGRRWEIGEMEVEREGPTGAEFSWKGPTVTIQSSCLTTSELTKS